ncbi:cystatin-like cysteine protease inhibitor domain-containing protein [Trypanosoma rangeli]|uniref:Cystatin-like cysteine protease inhibitor domain-containing protein n=1 Tax=Trypanosoma rangeli TaxID=5698 RepID=A0A3R7NLJ7_TRYRA|nr:cystatin-like cysteine protease inhibitor domain-containing protein [Trypanosoma rangeli]RNF08249.1 cystatin-like cysteine protease inhibitor domain-containing protein [Trypanosoma rangeli]|eukprot:RNF08249.1 cystatin-like cysteine protease inhibitor domain-containing protein [Trypanosoma rangeli]
MIRVPLRELWAYLDTPWGIIICYVFMNNLAGSIWTNAWTPLIYQKFGNSNLYVGLMSALNGTTQMLFAILGGHLADKVIGPSRTLIFAVRFGVFSLLFSAVSVWIGNLYMLVGAQILYGVHQGFNVTSVESVFAQCTKRSERDRVYGVKFSFESSGPIGGLVLSLILFAAFGNTWRVDVLRWVIITGLLVHIVSMQVFLFYFRPLPSHVDASAEQPHAAGTEQVALSSQNEQEEDRSPHVEEEIVVYATGETVVSSVSPTPEVKKQSSETYFPLTSVQECGVEATKEKRGFKQFCVIPVEKYPYVIVLGDLIVVLGSGMTTQYFSLFMMNIYFVSPVGLSALGLTISVLVSVLAIANSHLGSRIGRARALLLPRLLGSFILLYMALARQTSAGPKWLMCIAYVLRMAVMGSTTALSRALIMDFVPEERRGMWNALESVQSASWSGTALVGGYIADRMGYGAAFIVTFFFHITSCMVIAPCTVKNDTLLVSRDAKEGAVQGGEEVLRVSKMLEGDPMVLRTDNVVVHGTTPEQEQEEEVVVIITREGKRES